MNKEWSEQNRTMQMQLRSRDTFSQGIGTLIALRNTLMQTLMSFRERLSGADFSAMPFLNANGFHNKTVAYSLWHIFRIEDIVAHTLIKGDAQVFFTGHYAERINAPLITTGNELVKDEIAEFSKQLDIHELYLYLAEVKESTEAVLRELTYEMLRQKIPAHRREALLEMNVVSPDEKAAWLIDYWCGRDIRGLIRMPFSRHWIMHTEACLRIADRIRPAESRSGQVC